jgi:hypothetical protein
MYEAYDSKLLYRQRTATEEGHDVMSSVHGLTWKLPGGTTPITTRARLTIVTNFHDSEQLNVITATVELWKENGWLILEEMFDTSLQLDYYDDEEVEEYCLAILKTFFTGAPLEVKTPGTGGGTPPKKFSRDKDNDTDKPNVIDLADRKKKKNKSTKHNFDEL